MSPQALFETAVAISKTISASCNDAQESEKLLKLIAKIIGIRWPIPL